VLGKRESTGTKVKEEAKKILAARMGRAVLGLPDPTALRNVKYEEARERLFADYRQKAHSSLKTLKNGKVTIDGLPYVDKFFGGRSLVDIDRAMLDKFVEQRQRDGASNAYINRNLALLHRAMKLLSEDKHGALFVPKFPKLKEARARQGFCEPERFAKLLAVLAERLKTFILFLYTVGCRSGEAKKLEWSQVDWSARLIRVHEDQTKNREARTISLAPIVFERLQDVPERDRTVAFSGSEIPGKRGIRLVSRQDWGHSRKGSQTTGMGSIPGCLSMTCAVPQFVIYERKESQKASQ
jgi:integrase